MENKDINLDEIATLCKPIADYLRENYSPHCGILITDGYIKLISTDASIPTHTILRPNK